MKTEVGKLILEAMARQSLTRTELVRKMGYGNISRGHQRLNDWCTGARVPSGEQPKFIAQACGVQLDDVVQAMLADQHAAQQRRLARRAENPHYYIVMRLMPAVYPQEKLPLGTTAETALRLAQDKAKAMGRRCCVDSPDGTQTWIDEKGTVYGVSQDRAPTMRIGKRTFRLALSNL